MISKLKDQNLIDDTLERRLCALGDVQKEFVFRAAKLTRTNAYSESYKSFALTLNYHSPRAYNYLRTKFALNLPAKSTITKWYSNCDARCGFTASSFEAIEALASQSSVLLVLNVTVDEAKVSEEVSFNENSTCGYDYGMRPSRKIEISQVSLRSIVLHSIVQT